MLDADAKLCALEDIADNDAFGMVACIEGKQRNIFVVWRGDAAYAYINWCPHAQLLLDQVPGKFFEPEHKYIRCGMHAATFQVEDGLCIQGPCEGESLKSIKIEIQDGAIYMAE